MSTDQTGVNVPTQDDAAEGSQGRAPRSSRRAIRQAERAAEREAILTGQQPLLTRREMRRLREEAAALKAAVEAGEITPEQARALQDPTAQQPEAAASAPEAGDAAEAGSAAPGSPRSASAQSPQAAAAWSSAQGAHSAPGAHSPTAAASAGSAAPAASIDRPLGDDTAQAPAVAESSQPEAADQPGPSWRSLTADEAVAISELPTGLMDAVDLPIISAEAERAAAEQVSGEPAPVPTRSSLRERLETGQVPSVAGLGAEADGASSAAGQAAGGTWAQQPAAAAQEAPGAQIDGDARALPAWQADQRADEAAVLAADAVPVQEAQAGGGAPGAPGSVAGAAEPGSGQGAGQAAGQEAPVAATPSSVRRPIVKIPAAAQGVRTVNVSTGELSAIQPVSPAEDAVVDQMGQDGAQDSVAVEAVGEVSQDAQETTVQEAIAMEGADFEGSGAPQWKSLRERMTSDNSLVGGQQPVSPYSTTTTGAEETTSVEYAPVAEGGFPVAGAAGAPGAAGPTGTAWDQVPSTVPAVAEVSLSQDEEPQRSGGGLKVALILLVVIVVALLVLALVWYLMSSGSSSSAAGPGTGVDSSAEPWIQQIV